MKKKRLIKGAVVFAVIFAVLIIGIVFTGNTASENGETESVTEVMKDAVLHEHDKIDLFGIVRVNPGLVSAFCVTLLFIAFALIVRIFVIPKFKERPGSFQALLEAAVDFFDGLAKSNSGHRSGFIGAYIFGAGAYIFVSTLFELLGFQAVTVNGRSVSLPAPLSDINGAIAMGILSYGVILFGGLVANGPKGAGKALKDFSLPISLSFRLFGALLGGALVTELVYYYALTSFVVPVLVGVLFTLLHAIIQTYVLTTLVSIFYGESTEKNIKSEEKS